MQLQGAARSRKQSKNKTINAGKVVGTGSPHALLVGMQIGTVTMQITVVVKEKNLKVDLSYDPDIPFLGIYPKDCFLL